jgi:signal transduction histidine kinase/ligand-binding sensor domain-containing protein
MDAQHPRGPLDPPSTDKPPGGAPRRVRPTTLVAAFTAALLTATVGATPLVAQHLPIRTYTAADGLPGEGVGCLVTDRDGFLWICLVGGLALFDGTRFVVFGTEDGLPDPVVNFFSHGPRGTRWVATNGGGIARLDPDAPSAEGRVFTSFPVGQTPRSMRVNVLHETADGVLLAGTDGGLFQARATAAELAFEPVPLNLPGQPDSGLQVWALTSDADRIWVGTSAGLALLMPGHAAVHLPIAPAQGADAVFAIVPDKAGRLWIGHDAGLFVWMPAVDDAVGHAGRPLVEVANECVPEGEAPTVRMVLPDAPRSACHWAPAENGSRPSTIYAVVSTPDGSIWFASGRAILRFDGRSLHRFGSGRALPASGVQRMGVDLGGGIWLGTQSGAHRVLHRSFAQFTAEDGIPAEQVRRVMRGPDAELYAVTANNSVLRFDGARWLAVRPRLPPLAGVAGRSRYGAALLDRTGSWWIGTGEGLLRYAPTRRLEDLARAEPTAHYTTANGLASDVVWHLYEDARGDIWIASRIPGSRPLTRWVRSTGGFHRYGGEAGLPAERAVAAFAETGDGVLWVSLWDGGLARFDGYRFEYFEPERDVPPGHRAQMVVDPAGWLWVGGRQLLFTRDPSAPRPTFEEYRTTDGHALSVEALAVDSDGWLLASTFSGIVRIRADGRFQQLGGGSVFAGMVSAFHRDPDGTLWVPREGQILRYVPHTPSPGQNPPVWIGGVRVAGTPVAVPAMGARMLPEMRLRPDHRQIQIEWFSLDFGVEDRPRFQFRLEGSDRDWSDPTSDLSVHYASLEPGRYRFLVRALNAAGDPSPEPATLAFVVTPPLYRRGWFAALMITVLAALLFGIHRGRLRRMLELERIKSRIAADLHDEIGASLARVSVLAEATRRSFRARPDAADALLGEIGDTSRSLVTAVGDVAFCIDPGRGALDAFVARVRRFGDDLLAGSGIEWDAAVHGDTAGIVLSSDQRRHLLAIVKEALRNALRHSSARHIALTIEATADSLTFEFSDDGQGFDADAAARNGGHGLRNLRQRAGELGGQFKIVAQAGAGTRVVVELPVRPDRMFMQ